jgi:hypothetical protein
MDRIEMPWRTEQKDKAKKEAPVTKVHDKRNYKGINESQEVAVSIVRDSLKMQSEVLKEKLQERKLQIFMRRSRCGTVGHKTLNNSGG